MSEQLRKCVLRHQFGKTKMFLQIIWTKGVSKYKPK